MIAALIAAACTCTFSATATGLEKGAPVEFLFAAQDSDNAYETMFLVDDSIDEFCRKDCWKCFYELPNRKRSNNCHNPNPIQI